MKDTLRCSVGCGSGARCRCYFMPYSAIFTGWLYDQIADRTNASWARDFITMYADDTVLQWQVQRVRDLNFMCECARHTFAVLQEAGMSLNSSKPRIVIRLQGSQARAWMKKHLVRTPTGPNQHSTPLTRVFRCTTDKLQISTPLTRVFRCTSASVRKSFKSGRLSQASHKNVRRSPLYRGALLGFGGLTAST